MGLYKIPKQNETSLTVNESSEGETIEQKIDRIVNNKEAIKDGAPPIYTERKDGIIAAYDIRTDKMEKALEAMDVVHKTEIARRKDRIENREKEIKDMNEKQRKRNEAIDKLSKEDGGAEPTQGTSN